jgi:hypothetical protein
LLSLIEGEEGQSLATAIKLSFPGSNPNPKLEPFERLETVISFLKGSDPSRWHTKVPAWGGVRYKELYPGVDLVLEGEGGRIKMRWEALPRAELERLRLRVEGAREVSLEGGSLILVTDVGEFSLRLPVLEGADGSPEVREVHCEGGKIAYEVTSPWAEEGEAPAFQATDDPSDLLYGTFIGGSAYDCGYGIAVDGEGNSYVTGETHSSDFPKSEDAFDPSLGGSRDAFVVKLNPNGSSLVYGTFIGGSYDDLGYGIAVDGEGNAYVTGVTESSNFPTKDAFDPSYNGGWDAFVVKLNPNGSSLVYGTFIGGSYEDSGRGISVDGGGNAYVTGYTQSSNFPTTSGAFDTSHNGSRDAFVVKLNPNGSSLLYGTFIGGSYDDWGYGIAVDEGGNAYVTGMTYSSDFPTKDAFDPSLDVSHDAFVVKLNQNGSSLVYGTFIGGSGWDEGRGISVDGGGNAYVTGYTYSSDFPTTSGAFDTSLDDGDAFAVKLDPNGSSLVYGTFIGGSYYDLGYGIAVDGGGNAYVTGYTPSSDFLTTSGAFDRSHNGYQDAFVVKLDPDGSSLVYGTFIGGSDYERGYGIAVDREGNAYVTGYTYSSDFPKSEDAFDPSLDYYSDAFVVKLKVEEEPTPTPTLTPTSTLTPTPTSTPTLTPTPTKTPTPTPTSTQTPSPTSTHTPTPTITQTPFPSPTPTTTPSPSPTSTKNPETSTIYLPLVLKNYKHNPYEPNDRFEEAYGPLYQGVSYFSYPDDQYDYYFFELLSSHSVLIEVRNYKAESGDLLLYDEGRNLIGQWGRGGSEMRIEKEVLPPGRYYILVHTDPNFGFNMEDLYELKYKVGNI